MNKRVDVPIRVCCVFVLMYVCIFEQCVCIWTEHLESRPLTLLTVLTCDEREVGGSGLEEEGTIFLINIIVNHDFFKMMDMNHFKNKLSFLSPRICALVCISTSLAFTSLSVLDSSLVNLIYRTLRENVY